MTKTKLTTEQFDAIQKSHDAMYSILQAIIDIQDIYLSDIRKLDDAFYSLRHQFKLNENDS